VLPVPAIEVSTGHYQHINQVHPILKKSSSEEKSSYERNHGQRFEEVAIRPILKKKSSFDSGVDVDKSAHDGPRPILKRNRGDSGSFDKDAFGQMLDSLPPKPRPFITPLVKQSSDSSSNSQASTPECNRVITQEEIEADLKKSEDMARVVQPRRKSHPTSSDDLRTHRFNSMNH
jgi:hypothetical protein